MFTNPIGAQSLLFFLLWSLVLQSPPLWACGGGCGGSDEKQKGCGGQKKQCKQKGKNKNEDKNKSKNKQASQGAGKGGNGGQPQAAEIPDMKSEFNVELTQLQGLTLDLAAMASPAPDLSFLKSAIDGGQALAARSSANLQSFTKNTIALIQEATKTASQIVASSTPIASTNSATQVRSSLPSLATKLTSAPPSTRAAMSFDRGGSSNWPNQRLNFRTQVAKRLLQNLKTELQPHTKFPAQEGLLERALIEGSARQKKLRIRMSPIPTRTLRRVRYQGMSRKHKARRQNAKYIYSRHKRKFIQIR